MSQLPPPKHWINVKAPIPGQSIPGEFHDPATVLSTKYENLGQVLGFNGESEYGNPVSKITSITVRRGGDLVNSHWEIYLHEENGNIDKVDLIEGGYRILYGAHIKVPTNMGGTAEEIPLNIQPTLGYVCKAMAFIAGNKKQHQGNYVYNCQDFALILMTMLGVPKNRSFPWRLRRDIQKAQDKSNPMKPDQVNDLADWVWL
jgi:hypothetical protein